jgi:hypothetical protein
MVCHSSLPHYMLGGSDPQPVFLPGLLQCLPVQVQLVVWFCGSAF